MTELKSLRTRLFTENYVLRAAVSMSPPALSNELSKSRMKGTGFSPYISTIKRWALVRVVSDNAAINPEQPAMVIAPLTFQQR
jgi:hypothetical protein